MSRFFIICCFFIGNSLLFGQNDYKKITAFADEQMANGNYNYALQFYQQAMSIDSSQYELLWKVSLCQQALKNYPKAAYYFAKVYAKEECRIYPSSLLNWAIMEKQCGHYEQAIELFKNAKKKYAKNKKDYLYLKSKREFESCLWAQTAVRDTTTVDLLTLPKEVNSPFSEFGHLITNNRLYFSSLRADSSTTADEILSSDYINKLFVFDAEKSTLKAVNELNHQSEHVSNGTFSLDGKRFYFSRCIQDSSSYNCKIYCANTSENSWNNITELGEIINAPNSSTSMPAIGAVNGQEVLFFCSNKADGKGGMDLYYATIKQNGNQYSKPKALNAINSPDNEVTPWFDNKSQQLYFSSSWWDGFGGLDVFSTKISDGFTLETPKNRGLPFNSSENDNYYFEAGDSLFVSSNRLGSLYTNNPTCCSDIFAFQLPKTFIPPTKKETFTELNRRLPVTLYFHNDIPNPKSTDPTTSINYLSTYNDYIALSETYKDEYAKGLTGDAARNAQEDIESFFVEFVAKGVTDLKLFNELLLQELEKGNHIQLNVRGFASPLAKTDYNVNLTKRRIQSVTNELKRTNNGQFLPYIDDKAINGARLIIHEIPNGEYAANKYTSDNPNDSKNSIYSRAAAIERKIEIQSIEMIQRHPVLDSIQLLPAIIYTKNNNVNINEPILFQLFNEGANNYKIDRIEISTDLIRFSGDNTINGKSQKSLSFLFNSVPTEKFTCTIKVYLSNCPIPLILGVMGD
jgi:hypothetical protein